MKVKVLQPFTDYLENKQREIGDEFVVSKARYEELIIKLSKFNDKPFIEEVK